MTHDGALERALRRLREEWEPVEGLAYAGPADFVLRHGSPYRPRLLPAYLPRGHPRSCYGNAIVLAASRNLTYVEGYALTIDGRVMQHAWNADGAGWLIDSTWFLPGLAYRGVAFSVERADDCTWNGDATVLDDFRRGWPLLQTPWEGEPPGLEWEPTRRLEILRTSRRAAARALTQP